MKKLLSVVLAAILITGLFSTAFAAEKNLTVHDNTIEYKFIGEAYNLTSSLKDVSSLFNTEINKTISDQWNFIYMLGLNWQQLRVSPGDGLFWNAREYKSDKGETIVGLSVVIDRAGTYTPELTYTAFSSGYIHDIYLAKSNAAIDAEIAENGVTKSSIIGLCTEANRIGTVDMFAEQETIKTVKLAPITVSEEDKGRYILVLSSNSYNDAYSPHVDSDRTFITCEINSLKLVKDVNADAIANGELTFVTGMEALNSSKMYIHGLKDNKTEGLRGKSLLQYYQYIDWAFTTTLGGTGSGNKTATTVDEYNTMNLANTDPYKLDNSLLSSTLGIAGFVSTGFNLASGTGMYGTAKYSSYYDSKTGLPASDRPLFAFRVVVPYAGKYIITTRGDKYFRGVVADVRFAKATSDSRLTATNAAKLPIVGQYFANEGTEELGKTITDITATPIAIDDRNYGQPIEVNVPEAGEYWIVYDTSKRSYDANKNFVDYTPDYQPMSITGIKLTPVAEDNMIAISAESDKSSLVAGEMATISTKATYAKAGETDITDLTYNSSNPSVARVTSEGKILAISGGRALITVSSESGNADSFFVNVVDKETEKSVSYATATNVNDVKIIKSDLRGTEVTVTAGEVPGYTFRHWVRGTADNGTWMSADESYTFTLMTNTYLTAVYSPKTTGKLVEFFNENGEYFAEAIAEEGDTVPLPATNPERTGFKFAGWRISGNEEFTAETILKDAITRVVARFEDTGDVFTVTTPDGTDTYSYGEKIKLTAPYSVYWLCNGVVTDYGTEYTYFVWDNAVITTSGTGTNVPRVVVADSKKAGNAAMIEYDAAGHEIIEVGIIFGDGEQTVDSCDSKATSQYTKEHGQFTAKPATGGTTPRGYLIYNDGGTYRVIYSD